jgi:hypothetical protein
MGMEFIIPAALSAISAGVQYENQSQANNREQNSEAAAINEQNQIRQKGMTNVNQTVKSIAGDNPQALAAQAQAKYVQQLRANAAGSTQGGSTSTDPQLFGVSTSALPPGDVGSAAYKKGTAASQKEVEQYGDTEASEMGDLDAAVRMRQNEGLEQQTLGTNLNTLGAESYGQNFVSQLQAQQAGQLDPWASLFSSLAGGAGSTLSKNPQLMGNPGAPSGWSPTLTNNGAPAMTYGQQVAAGF